LVVEPSAWIGGQAVAAGVSNMDDLLPTRSGLYREFIAKVGSYYDGLGKSMGTCYWNRRSIAFEPFTGERMLYEMTAEARASSTQPLDILLRASVTRVERQGNTVTGVTVLDDGMEREIKCRVLIDATEYGDVIPLAGAEYRAGNSVSPSIDPEAIIQDITWVAIIKKYPDGIPQRLRVTEPLPGYDLARRIYERYVTADGGAFTGTYPIRLPVDFITHNVYRGLPDSSARHYYDARRSYWNRITKAGVNWGNDYPGHVIKTIPGLPVKYLEDEDQRAWMEKEAFIKTLHFIYYIQNELEEPWSIADDEYDNVVPYSIIQALPESWREIARHMPPIPYVRESRRIVGEHTLTSVELLRNSQNYTRGESHEFEDSIGIGRYSLDLHAANADSHMERELGESAASIGLNQPRGPFQVPLRILIPRNIEGLIAAEKNLSMTRQVSGALRVQPICMLIGQAAGALAALAARDGVSPGEIPAARVQRVLLDAGVTLSLNNYLDVPPRHNFYKAVQFAGLYGLMNPVTPPYPNRWIRNVWWTRGVFGVNKPVTRDEMAVMINRARRDAGESAGGAEPVTRAVFMESVSRAFGFDLDALGVPGLFGARPNLNRPITRGEAAEILMRAMTM
ncbi:MAG: FAD-dependent oxidoreductase, partial [Synergistaceae bacterium]|nr:FAD-dependent oxidoreductase [Synergistaceae bacterium]